MKMMKMSVLGALAAVTLAAVPVAAQTVNFDTITTGANVDSYYDGGTSSLGDVGPDYNIVFQTGDWVTTTSFGQTSAPNLAYSASGAGYVDFLSGITTGLNFSYGAFTDSSLSLYTGLAGTGTLIGTFALPTNDPFDFDFVALPFAGVARSAVITSGGAQFGWDDITFGSLTPGGGVPEPATWGMMILGFGMIGAAMRRRATVSVAFQA